ncbi:MAG: PilN domain-containing protein [Gammaproteobacteria bacterium]|nr:PilN domain-containing protein [Gammaproteobacteria bacterium]
MKQQINLYQPIFRTEKKVFTALAMAEICGMVIVGLAVMYGYAAWQVHGLKKEVSKIEEQRNVALKKIDNLHEQFPGREKSKQLEDEIQELTQELMARTRIADILSGGALGNTNGFSDYLEALARRHVQGTWLTEVSISNGGQTIGIAGSTLVPDLVPMYLQRLSDEEVFKGLSFNVMQMQRASDTSSQVDFTVRTDAAKE